MQEPISKANHLHQTPSIIGTEYSVNHVRQRPVKVLSRLEVELLDKEDIVFERGVHVWIETESDNDRVVVAVDVRIDAEETLDELADGALKVLGEVDACQSQKTAAA